MPSRREERISDTVESFHEKRKIPKISNTDAIVEADIILVATLSRVLSSHDSSLYKFHTNQVEHIEALSSVLPEIVSKGN